METIRIYKIVNDIDDEVYVGSMKENSRLHGCLKAMLNHYRHNARKNKGNSKLLQCIRKHGVEHFKIVSLEDVECGSINERRQHQQKWIDELKPTLNEKFIDKEQKQANNEKKYDKEYKKQSNIKNNIQVRCECGSVVTKYLLTRHKQTKKHINYLEQNLNAV